MLAAISLLPNRSRIWQLYTVVEVCQVSIAVFAFA